MDSKLHPKCRREFNGVGSHKGNAERKIINILQAKKKTTRNTLSVTPAVWALKWLLVSDSCSLLHTHIHASGSQYVIPSVRLELRQKLLS